MNILVLGATGTFGTALTEKLLKHTDDKITLFARHASEKYSADEHTAVMDGDALNLDDLKNAIKKTRCSLLCYFRQRSAKDRRKHRESNGTGKCKSTCFYGCCRNLQ